ncbi:MULTISPECIES: transporter substrate-binding domain-containing protein [Caballeronia]|uniref:transporter substrate-binding domain-containing protein n=1 Tax=Caballeronia TaxID=1827195 RepID=UPI001FD3F4AE|nr:MULTISPECIES: transporter substrate-binding domain-containing protein [Caballeronia]
MDGLLRVSINIGNPMLAHRNDASGAPEGVSVDIARELAARLGAEVQWVVCEKAAQSVEAVKTGDADIGFFAVDPARAAHIAFSEPYLLIEGAYLVKEPSSIMSAEDVDRADHTVVVSVGSAYDLYLTRALHHARFDRTAGPHDVVETFLKNGRDVAAGIRPLLENACREKSGLRMIDGHFMVIEQAVGVSQRDGAHRLDCIAEHLNDMKQNGFIADALKRHGIEGPAVAHARIKTMIED